MSQLTSTTKNQKQIYSKKDTKKKERKTENMTYPQNSDHVIVLKFLVAIQREQNINEIPMVRISIAFLVIMTESVLFNDAQDEFPDSGDKFRAPLVYAKRIVEKTQPWNIIGPVESAQELEPFSNHVLELLELLPIVRRLVSFAENARHDVVQRRRLEVVSQGDETEEFLLGRNVSQHGCTFYPAAAFVG